MNFTKNPKNLIYGKHPIMEALEAGKAFDKLFIQTSTKSESLREIKQLALEMGIIVQGVPFEKLKRLTNASHQGIAGYLSLIQYYKVEDILSQAYEKGEIPLFLVLDGIQDVRNFGAIVRTASCFGVHAIIVPKYGAAPVSADAIKASAGALATFPICRVNDLKESLHYLKENGLSVAATSITKSNDIGNCDFNVPLAVVLGSEEKGVQRDILRVADFEINIEHQQHFNSLNVSVANGIIMYEVGRQRKIE